MSSKRRFATIEEMDFIFQNTPVKVVANRSHPEIELIGLKVGPFEEGKEYEVKFWIARELEKNKIARIREDYMLTLVKLYKIHWRERVQEARQLAPMSEDFYPKLRKLLADLKREALSNAEKIKEYEKAERLSKDILNCRLKKIVSLASAPAQTDQTLKNLTMEERSLYEQLHELINQWKEKTLKLEGEK